MTTHFNPKLFSQLIELAKGEKVSMNQFATRCGVTVSYISRLIRAVNEHPPSPQIIRKFADAAINGVTYEQLMQAAGYLADGEPESSPSDLGIREMMIAKEELTPEFYEKFVDFTRGARKAFVQQMESE